MLRASVSVLYRAITSSHAPASPPHNQYINTSHPDFIGGSRAVARFMEKIGQDNQARKNAQGTATGTETPGVGGTSHNRDVGATPLSSSSLSNYYNPHGDDADSVRTGTLPPNSYDMSGGGIMNFIFRGGKHTKANAMLEQERLQNGPPSIVNLPQVPDTMRQTDVPPTERERVEIYKCEGNRASFHLS